MSGFRMLNYGLLRTYNVACPICKLSAETSRTTFDIEDYLNKGSNQIFTYEKCDCGVLYLRNRPIEEDLHLAYSTEYDAYKLSSGLVSRIKKIRMVKLLRPLLVRGRETRILDYGCGSGEFLYSISSQVDTTLIGYDINPFKPVAQDNLMVLNNEIQLGIYSPFDLIFSFQVIEHLQNPLEFLEFMKSLLSEDGIVILETPTSSGLLFTKIFRQHWGGWHAPRHFVIFDQKTLTDLSEAAGFEVLSINYIPTPFQWIETVRAYLPQDSMFQRFLTLNNFFIVAAAYAIDFFTIKIGHKTSNMKFVLRKA